MKKFKERNAVERGIGTYKRVLIYGTIFITYTIKMSPASFDVGTDTALLSQYGTDFHNLTVTYPKNCPTSLKLLISAKEAFCWALGPIILACMINLLEAASYLTKRGSHFHILLKIIIVILSPFWLILVCMIGAYEELKKRLGQTTEGDAEKTILNAKRKKN